MIAKSYRSQVTATVLASLLGLWGTQAQALSLGRLSVQSTLGEPLRAEIDIPDINAEEAASLRAQPGLPAAFKAAGLEYSPSMSGLQISLQKRPDGRSFLLLVGDRAINDPFVDMILEANWSSGRLVRDYTMLFDPPKVRPSSSPIAAATPLPLSAPARSDPAAQGLGGARPTATPSKVVTAAPKPPSSIAAKPAPSMALQNPAQIIVSEGDTASKIAAARKPAGISLDQMLVAMMRANPDAFIKDNVNRIKAGAVVMLPSEVEASATTPEQATEIVVAQSQDFDEFRRKFASNVPVAQVSAADRSASGKLQATVEDKKPAALTPDKLTLSKGAVQGKTNEDQLARDRSAKEAANRTAEIAKNISDLNKLVAASGPQGTTPAAKSASAAPGLSVVAAVVPASAAADAKPAMAKEAASAAVMPSSAASLPASAPVAVVSEAKKPAPAASKPPALPVQPPPEPSFMDTLMDNPLLPAGGAGLVALLAGLAFYKVRQRKKAADDSSLLESRLQPESFFGNSGGKSIDTNENLATGSSMVYSPSQLDAADDVDPVAEADVYLAYGRDLQAEEILKDALRTQPDRLAIHQKLLEIYAKRRDAKAFESVAILAFNLTNGSGAQWEKVCESGLVVDPANALYQPGGQPVAPTAAPSAANAAQGDPETGGDSLAGLPPVGAGIDLDLDLDFSLDDLAPPTPAEQAPASLIAAPVSEPLPSLDLDPVEPATQPSSAQVSLPPLDGLDFSLPDISLEPEEPPKAPTPPAPAPQFDQTIATQATPAPTVPPAAEAGMIEFDLGSLSMDLQEEAPITEPGALAETPEDPLETKLALAEEFRAIGDDDGARALIEEVIAEAAGDVKVKAQRALSKL